MKQLLKSVLFAVGLALAMIAVLPKPAVAAPKTDCQTMFQIADFNGAGIHVFCDGESENYDPDLCAAYQDAYNAALIWLAEHNCEAL